MIVVVREEGESVNVYTAIRDDNGKPAKFKTISAAEEKIKPVLETSGGPTTLLLLLDR